MLYREMKKNKELLSILGFGCMRLPTKNGRIDTPKATEMVHKAIREGVNYFDTAYMYHNGASESFLGKALSGGTRKKVKIATKLPPYKFNSKADMDNILNQQLVRLQTNHIDYYLVHNVLNEKSWDRLVELGLFSFLEQAKKDGKIDNIGFSFHGSKTLFKKVVDAYDWDFCQIQYNYLDENNQAGTEGLRYAAEKGLGVIIMEPLRGGNLAGKIPQEVEQIWNKAETKRTPVEWALQWIWNHPEVTVVLSGMTEEAHVNENIRIASEAKAESLTEKELALFEDVKKTYRRLMKIGCTACQYCMPCPAGVNIPMCFEQYNNKYLFGKKSRFYYYLFTGGIMTTPSHASLCIQCGKCEAHCPQHIPIRKELKQVSSEMEGFMMKPLVGLLRRVMLLQSKIGKRKTKYPT